MLARRMARGCTREAVLAELEAYDPYDDYSDAIAVREDKVPKVFAWKIVYLNDQEFRRQSPEERYQHVLSWAQRYLPA